jgi:hypothetical protein
MTDDIDLSERISISYRGHGEMFEASLHADAGLTAHSAYHWLLRAIRSIGFDQLAEVIENQPAANRPTALEANQNEVSNG